MTNNYKKRLILLADSLQDYLDTTDSKDLPLLSKLQYLLGYIKALRVEKRNNGRKNKQTLGDQFY